LKCGLGFGEQFVFYSIRKTVATIFKDAGVPEATAADILGHEIATMSYGVYAGDVSLVTKADAIAKLRCPATA
jgi:integrase